MPFVDIDLIRGKSADHLERVSAAIRRTLVAELGMKPDDNFQLIHQHEPGEMVFTETFRGGPRSADWTVVRITDGTQRDDATLRRFYKALAAALEEDAGVRPEDVFVTIAVSPKENFSFAGGVAGSEIAEREALDAAAKVPGTRDAYTREEMVEAITRYFREGDRGPLVSMLGDDFVLKVPTSLPYGGEFVGAEAFDEFVARIQDGSDIWEEFVTSIDGVIEAGDHLVAPLTNRAKAAGKVHVIENLWLFTVADGNLVSAQIYADTAAAADLAK
jgi:ketosteroid isomerase-like protein/phenylpyruvate tautomerase PptA (4-oxalocrotonate tautomerase family)